MMHIMAAAICKSGWASCKRRDLGRMHQIRVNPAVKYTHSQLQTTTSLHGGEI
jgi:hypothetical protein